jgi:hypothetical protein
MLLYYDELPHVPEAALTIDIPLDPPTAPSQETPTNCRTCLCLSSLRLTQDSTLLSEAADLCTALVALRAA